MNRYTQLSTTQFNPLSIEELSIVPMAMRQKHDQASAQLEERRAALNAFGESLPHHQERAHSLIQQMNSAIDNEAEQLNNNGYTRTTGSNIIKLNRDYQNLMAPNGELGKIASAKKTYSENYKQYVEDGQKKGWGLDRIQNGWANHAKNYFGYDEEGNVTTIGQAGAPEKYELTDALKSYAPLVGQIKQRLDSMGGGDIVPGPDGMLMVVNKSGSVHQLTNSPQLQQLNALLMSEFLTPGGKGYESAMYAGKDLQTLKNEIGAAILMMTKDEITDTTSISRSLVKGSGSEGDGSPGPYHTGMFNIDNRYDMSISKYDTHALFKDRLGALTKDKTKLTASELREFEALEAKNKMLQDELRQNEDYREARKIFLEENKVTMGSYSEEDPRSRFAVNDNLSMNINRTNTSNLSTKAQDALNRMIMIENETFQNLPTLVSSYAVPKTNNPKANAAIEAIGKNVLDIFRGGNDRIHNNFEIVSVVNDKGKIVENPNADSFDDYESNVLELLRKAKKVELIGSNINKVHNDDEAQFNIQLDKNDKSTLDWFRGSVGTNGNVTVTLRMKKGQDAKSIPMIKGLIANLYHNYGGESGKYFAQEMANSSAQTNMNEFFEANNFTYGDYDNDSSFLTPREEELVQLQILRDASIEKGIDYRNLTQSQADKLANDYIQNHSQQVIRTYNN